MGGNAIPPLISGKFSPIFVAFPVAFMVAEQKSLYAMFAV